MLKHVLITNDDGIESAFLHILAEALGQRFRITVAAPAIEQSWIGRAVSRRRAVAVNFRPEYPWPTWTIDGTPTDCVNIALGHLVDGLPDAVVSGINIGYNTSTTLIYSSGTVAGALEGAFWGLPAFAISQEVPDTLFEQVTHGKGVVPPDWQPVLEANAAHVAEFIERMLHAPNPAASRDAIVHNLNYPARPRQPFETVLTVPVPLRELALFERDGPDQFNFRYQQGVPLHSDRKTDREAISAGAVSHSILNFSALGRDLNH